MTSPAPTKVLNNLRTGCTSVSFPFYNWDAAEIARFKAALPEMKSKGLRGIRLTISMDSWEDTAKTGKLRADRWTVIEDFCNAMIALDMTPILDNHNTGIRGDDGVGDWESDYMGDLRKAPVRTRHINLMKAVALKIQTNPTFVNEVVLTPANEPIFDRSSADAAIWWNHQKALIPALRSVAPDVMITYMAQDWNGLEAFVNNWDAQMKVFAAPNGTFDPRLFADVHFYEPIEFTHSKSSAVKYPGSVTTWRGTNNWTKTFIKSLIKPLDDFAKAKGLPFVFISEYGTDKLVDRESRLRYLTDLSDLFREFGWGHAVYTWSEGDNFKINGVDDRIWAAVAKPGTVTPPTDPPVDPPTEPPTGEDALSALEAAAVNALIDAKLVSLNALIDARVNAKVLALKFDATTAVTLKP